MSGSLLLVICVFLSAAASIFLKIGASRLTEPLSFLSLISNQMIWVGATFYAAAFIGYIFALRLVPLSLAQPIITVGVSALTMLVAVVFFREPMLLVNWAGFLLICVGISFLFFGRI